MARIVFSGILERHPDLKILIHHGGSMVPHFAGRVGPGWDQLGARTPPDRAHEVEHSLSKRPLEYFKMFYADTAMFGAAHAIQCCIEFFGVDRILFASDTPFDPEKGPGYIRSTIENLESLDLSAEDREKIYAGNARRVLGVA
jgi:aminocarboxymuconate-semialdehyde decarboxylase